MLANVTYNSSLSLCFMSQGSQQTPQKLEWLWTKKSLLDMLSVFYHYYNTGIRIYVR